MGLEGGRRERDRGRRKSQTWKNYPQRGEGEILFSVPLRVLGGKRK